MVREMFYEAEKVGTLDPGTKNLRRKPVYAIRERQKQVPEGQGLLLGRNVEVFSMAIGNPIPGSNAKSLKLKSDGRSFEHEQAGELIKSTDAAKAISNNGDRIIILQEETRDIILRVRMYLDDYLAVDLACNGDKDGSLIVVSRSTLEKVYPELQQAKEADPHFTKDRRGNPIISVEPLMVYIDPGYDQILEDLQSKASPTSYLVT